MATWGHTTQTAEPDPNLNRKERIIRVAEGKVRPSVNQWIEESYEENLWRGMLSGRLCEFALLKICLVIRVCKN